MLQSSIFKSYEDIHTSQSKHKVTDLQGINRIPPPSLPEPAEGLQSVVLKSNKKHHLRRHSHLTIKARSTVFSGRQPNSPLEGCCAAAGWSSPKVWSITPSKPAILG